MTKPLVSQATDTPASPLKEIGSNLIDDPGLWLEAFGNELVMAIKVFLPNLLGAVAVLVLGWLAAFVGRWLIHRFGKGLDALLGVVHRMFGQEVSRPRWSVSALAGNIAFWIVLAYAVSGAAELVGLVTFAKWILGLLGYLPRVLISLFTLFIGYLISRGVRTMIMGFASSSGFEHGETVGKLVSGLILAFTLLLALSQLGLDVTIFADIIVLAAAALFASIALAFGVGAGDAIKNVLASHYVRKTYRPGQRIRVHGTDGQIIELTPVAVILETDEGESWIPARHFLDSVVITIEAE
jgi:small-conductance mechanosensitive channel